MFQVELDGLQHSSEDLSKLVGLVGNHANCRASDSKKVWTHKTQHEIILIFNMKDISMLTKCQTIIGDDSSVERRWKMKILLKFQKAITSAFSFK